MSGEAFCKGIRELMREAKHLVSTAKIPRSPNLLSNPTPGNRFSGASQVPLSSSNPTQSDTRTSPACAVCGYNSYDRRCVTVHVLRFHAHVLHVDAQFLAHFLQLSSISSPGPPKAPLIAHMAAAEQGWLNGKRRHRSTSILASSATQVRYRFCFPSCSSSRTSLLLLLLLLSISYTFANQYFN